MLQIIRKSLPTACMLTATMGAIFNGIENQPAIAGCNPFGCSQSSAAECNPFGCPNPPLGAECSPFGCPPSPQSSPPPHVPNPPVGYPYSILYPPPYPPSVQPNFNNQAPRATSQEIANCIRTLLFDRKLVCADPDGTCGPFSPHWVKKDFRTQISEDAAVRACTAGGR